MQDVCNWLFLFSISVGSNSYPFAKHSILHSWHLLCHHWSKTKLSGPVPSYANRRSSPNRAQTLLDLEYDLERFSGYMWLSQVGREFFCALHKMQGGHALQGLRWHSWNFHPSHLQSAIELFTGNFDLRLEKCRQTKVLAKDFSRNNTTNINASGLIWFGEFGQSLWHNTNSFLLHSS
jgi:hypothetical protein